MKPLIDWRGARENRLSTTSNVTVRSTSGTAAVVAAPKSIEGGELSEDFHREDVIAQIHRDAELTNCKEKYEQHTPGDPRTDQGKRDPAEYPRPASYQPSRLFKTGRAYLRVGGGG
jgi:hypothetical protein